MTRLQGILKTLGPGILFAGAAIGGSHLVQSTRAGADYGLTLLWLVLLINFLKYPFFEFAQRFTNVTGKNLLQGYLHLGRWVLVVYIAINLITSISSVAAVAFITANLASYILFPNISPLIYDFIIMGFCAVVLFIGNFPWLDRIVKILLLLLAICTVIAFSVGMTEMRMELIQADMSNLYTMAGLSFLLALMGWLPAPIEASTWTSLWAQRRQLQTKYHPNLRQTLFDFNLGYIGTTILAGMFLCLGAFVMYGSEVGFSASGVTFAGQLINLFSEHMGDWSKPLIAIAAFATMLSTTLTLMDGYPRALTSAIALLLPQLEKVAVKLYWFWLSIMIVSALLMANVFIHAMSDLLDVATILSFLTAPIFAYMNFRVIRCSLVSESNKPAKWLLILSVIGLLALLMVAIVYLISLVLKI